MTTGDVVYSLRFSLIKILPEPGFDLGSTAGESCVLTARLHTLDSQLYDIAKLRSRKSKIKNKKFYITLSLQINYHILQDVDQYTT